MNDKTRTIFYDQRVAISELRDEPVVWSCSKVEDMNVKGIARYTFKQDKWSEHTDYIEKDDDGNIIGMWCNWFDNALIPTAPTDTPANIHSKITYSGPKSEIKIGGNYKKFTVTFYNETEQIDFRTGDWRFEIDGQDARDVVATLSYEDSSDVNENQIKVKFTGDDFYIGKVLTISFTSVDGITSTLDMSIIGL